MDLVVLGTGPSRGWPEPGCACASCLTSARTRVRRSPAGVLVDGSLQLDGDRPVPAAAHRLRTADLVHHGPQQVGDHLVRILPCAGGSALDVTGPDGARLLHAPAGLPQPVSGTAYDAVLLGGPFAELPRALAGLRAAGGVAAAGRVVPVGLGHDAPPPEDLQRLLTAWGTPAVADGTALHVPDPRATAVAPPRRTVVLGGARSGKSALAEQLLSAEPHVTYVATGGSRPGDDEWAARVSAHRERRPPSWRTVETDDVAGCLRAAGGPVLVDCLGTWLAGRLDRHRVWDGAPVGPVDDDVDELVATWRQAPAQVVAVSNEVGSGVVPATASGRLFRDLLGRLNARLAAESETVLLTVAGVVVPLREPRPAG